MDRRDFLRTSTFAFLGLAASSCAKGTRLAKTQTLDDVIAGRAQRLQLLSVGTEVLKQRDERVAFGVLEAGTGARVIDGVGKLWAAPTRTVPSIGPLPIAYHGDGLGEKGIYEATLNFPSDGQWLVVVELKKPGSTDTLLGAATIQVGRTTAMPVPGDPAPVVATPTVLNHGGVDPICTRKPPCSMHEVSLDVALRSHKPTVVIIATPQFCQSALCGPEVDLVQEAAAEFAGRANFIHIEVYKDDAPDTIAKQILAPAAAAWKLDQEPALYLIDTQGVVSERALGPVDRADVRALVTKLVG